jgi:hypothetical protein
MHNDHHIRRIQPGLQAAVKASGRTSIAVDRVTAAAVLQIVLNTVSPCGNMTAAVSQIPAE